MGRLGEQSQLDICQPHDEQIHHYSSAPTLALALGIDIHDKEPHSIEFGFKIIFLESSFDLFLVLSHPLKPRCSFSVL
jgi:hypothetical protein